MNIPPRYTISDKMLSLITKIEAERLHFSSLNLPQELKDNIQRVSLLKSSLFSARIEGNPLKISDFEIGIEAGEEKKKEVFNILEAIKYIDKNTKSDIKKDLLSHLHILVMKDIAIEAGSFRREVSAIFNQAGIAIYMPPPPTQIVKLLEESLAFINSDEEKFPLINAFVAHLLFEKIHPFIDGNGRVGRLLISAILKSKGWDFTFAVPFEEYLDEHKNDYYYYLDIGLTNTADYLEFMLEAFYQQIEKLKDNIGEELSKEKNLFLPPRQEEIFNIMKDQIVVSFDMIRRRFLQVPERTLRYDLKKLFDKKLIEKSGTTKGSYYRVRK